MTERAFTPALGRVLHARFYDPIIALTGQSRWRGLVLEHLAPREDDVIADVGCGTGTMALMLRRAAPSARILALDPDPDVLAISRRKDAELAVEWLQCMGDALTDCLAPGSVSKLTSSLVLHQCPLAMKRAILASMFSVLRPGGKLVIADYGLQRTALMRLAFRVVQLADGKQDTQPNADGILPSLISEAGFRDVREAELVRTVTGSISIYVATRP